MPDMDLRFKARTLEFATYHIIFSTIFLYTFAHLMMMHLICVLCNFAFVVMGFVLGFFLCLTFACSLVLVASTCQRITIRHVFCKFAFVLLCFVHVFF
jgi:hypothetical protein